MNKKYCIFVLLFLFSLNFISAEIGVSASQSLGTFKPATCINLIEICQNCSFVNLTAVINPNSTFAFLGQNSMTKTGTIFNYTFCDSTSIGNYAYFTFGNLNGITATGNAIFSIDNSGISQTTSQGINSAIFPMLMIFLTVIFAALGFKIIDSDKIWIAGIFFIFLTLILLVYDSWLAVESYTNYIGGNQSTQLIQIIFFIIVSCIFLSVFVSALLLTKKIPDFIQKYLKINMDESDDGYDGKNFDADRE